MHDYEGRLFRTVSNSVIGDVTDDTIFHYHQDQSIVWAEYSGGLVVRGMLIAKVLPDGRLDMRYQHVNVNGELLTGKCISTPEILADGRYRLHENWQWTNESGVQGVSVVEEIHTTELFA